MTGRPLSRAINQPNGGGLGASDAPTPELRAKPRNLGAELLPRITGFLKVLENFDKLCSQPAFRKGSLVVGADFTDGHY